MKSFRKLGLFILTTGAVGLGSVALLNQPTYASPRPDCGPTRQWICVLPGCPDCYDVLFEGTVCEKAAYEKETGRKCSPA